MKTNTLTQLSSELQHRFDRLQDSVQASIPNRYNRLIHQTMELKGWLWGGIGLLLLWLWAWQWVLSIGLGLSVTVGVYLAQQHQLKWSWRGWSRVWNRSNRSATLAVLTGILAWGSTYLATALWLESDQPWLATSVLLEGFGILAIFGLLLWQVLNSQFQHPDPSYIRFQTLLNDLSDPDPLKRLLAVRQLTQMLNPPAKLRQPASLPMTATQVVECFRLMLERETEPLVCNALLDSLRLLQPARQLAESRLAYVSIRSTATTDPNPVSQPREAES